MPEFCFRQLDASLREIRLLDLLPVPGNEICCNIRHVSLNQASEYEALSYCWGTSSRTRKILVGDADFWVTENLYSALLRLKDEAKCRTLWVDAICIDQKNIPEKNIQVPLMRTIYESCSQVVIWLGEQDSHTQLAFTAIEYMAARYDDDPEAKIIGTRWRAAQRGANKNGFWAQMRDRLETLDGIRVLGSIFERQWFQRVWIVQELSVSPEAAVICGEHKTTWETIDKAYKLSHAVFDMEDHLGDLVSFRTSWQKGTSGDIFAQMMLGWNQDSTDARDKIYALMGLVPDASIQVPVTVDYGKGVKSTFQDFTEAYIKATNNIDILGVSRGCRNADDWESPSWALDDEYDKITQPFPQHSLSPIGDIERTKEFQAGGNEPCQTFLSDNHSWLGISGMCLETIKDMSVNFSYISPKKSVRGVIIDPWSNFANFMAFYLDARRLCNVEEGKTYSHTGQNFREAFWNTLQVFEPGWTESDDPVELRQECAAFDDFAIQVSNKLPSGNMKVAQLLRSLKLYAVVAKDILQGTLTQGFFVKAYASWKRRLIVLENGYIGLGPGHSQVGDKIVLLQGRGAPLVVRQVGTRYRVVGDCYIHGIIKGESFDPANCRTLWFE